MESLKSGKSKVVAAIVDEGGHRVDVTNCGNEARRSLRRRVLFILLIIETKKPTAGSPEGDPTAGEGIEFFAPRSGTTRLASRVATTRGSN
jgi:hypothetical protein